MKRLAGKSQVRGKGGVVADEVVEAVVLCQKALVSDSFDLLQRWLSCGQVTVVLAG